MRDSRWKRAAVVGVLCYAFIPVLANGQRSPAAPAGREIDAVTLTVALRTGKADQYKGFWVTGEGRAFHGSCEITHPDGKKETCLELTLAVLDQANKPIAVKTLKEWVPLEMAGRYQLGVSLRGTNLQKKPESNPDEPPSYTFRGRFDGETEQRKQTITISGAKPAVSTVPVLKDSTVK